MSGIFWYSFQGLLDKILGAIEQEKEIMPYQNRMTPHGDLIATPERGTLMGNRGILHEAGRIVRQSMHRGWITCLLAHGDNYRDVMGEGRYTSLFFLDEVVAFSAGHRPCFTCRPERFYQFKDCWTATNASYYKLSKPTMAVIDRVLHQERITRKDEKVSYQDNALNVARGAFVEYGGKYYLKWGEGNRFYEWTAAGYVSSITLPNCQQVSVLTPRSIVRMFKNGFVPGVHESINCFLQ